MWKLENPNAILYTRLATALNKKKLPEGFPWNSSTAHKLVLAISDILIDAVVNGEEITLGHLGKFKHKMKAPKTWKDNLHGGVLKSRPRRVALEFEPSTALKTKFLVFSEHLEKNFK